MPSRPGVYKADSIIDVADSLGITNISDAVAGALASDVEYRLHQIIEEAARFMRHSRRTTMTTSDIDQALKTLNVEPVYGHTSRNPVSFRRVQPSVGPPVYVVEDEEIDFDTYLNDEPVQVPRPVRYTAHWLAIEGVQPLIPENPPPNQPDPSSSTPKALTAPTQNGSTPPSKRSATPSSASDSASKRVADTVKDHLSRELQHYYVRLTTALAPSSSTDERKRTAALTSLRGDAGLQPLLPYLARWIAEGVITALRGDDRDLLSDGGELNMMDTDRRSLSVYLNVIHALLENDRLFIEPYLHQLLPPILSILLTSSLFTPTRLNPSPSHPTPSQLRSHASSILSLLLRTHAPTYPSLPARITKTVLGALLEPDRTLGTREGALRALSALGGEVVRRGLIGAGGGRVISEEVERARERNVDLADALSVEEALIMTLEALHPRSHTLPINPLTLDGPLTSPEHTALTALESAFGPHIANQLTVDRRWATGLVDALGLNPSANEEGETAPSTLGLGLGLGGLAPAMLNEPEGIPMHDFGGVQMNEFDDAPISGLGSAPMNELGAAGSFGPHGPTGQNLLVGGEVPVNSGEELGYGPGLMEGIVMDGGEGRGASNSGAEEAGVDGALKMDES